MSKQKKNSNYVTEKTAQQKEDKIAAKAKAEKAKETKLILTVVGAIFGVIALFIGFLAACGVFAYHPEVTYHATINLVGGESLHVELYGNDAPDTVKHFIDLCEDGYFDGKNLHTLKDSLLYGGSRIADGGSKTIKGEFSDNGFKNRVKMKKGVIAMARGEEYDSAYGQFFFLTKNNSKLNGQYAAFGRITDLDVLDNLVKGLTVDESGKISDMLVIKSVSLHAAH